MQLHSEESDTQSGSAGFMEAPPSVKLYCAEEARHELALAPGMSLPKDLLHLSHIVSNPNASESSWMNACVGAGERSLVPRFNIWTRTNFALKSTLGSILATMTFLLNFSVILIMTSEFAWVVRGFTHDNFIHGFPTVDGAALLAGMAAAVCFWMTLLVRKRRWWSSAAQGLSSFLALLVIAIGSADHLGTQVAALLTGLSLAGILLVKYVAKLCRECLPASFAAPKLSQSAISMLLVPAAFTTWLLYNTVTNNAPVNHENVGLSGVSVLAPILAFCVMGQGFAIARASKSISRSACTLLSTCVQAPLLLALGLSVASSIAVAFVPDSSVATISDWQFNNIWKAMGVERGVFMLGGALVAVALATAGGYLGAWANSLGRKCA